MQDIPQMRTAMLDAGSLAHAITTPSTTRFARMSRCFARVSNGASVRRGCKRRSIKGGSRAQNLFVAGWEWSVPKAALAEGDQPLNAISAVGHIHFVGHRMWSAVSS